MPETLTSVMTTDLVTCPADATIADAARLMRDRDIGDVLVTDADGRLTGIVTDRDIVVRCLAEGADARSTLDRACSSDVHTLTTASTVDEAVDVMREHALRRIPIVDDGRAIGIISIGDLAVEREPDSALGDISAAAPND